MLTIDTDSGGINPLLKWFGVFETYCELLPTVNIIHTLTYTDEDMDLQSANDEDSEDFDNAIERESNDEDGQPENDNEHPRVSRTFDLLDRIAMKKKNDDNIDNQEDSATGNLPLVHFILEFHRLQIESDTEEEEDIRSLPAGFSSGRNLVSNLQHTVPTGDEMKSIIIGKSILYITPFACLTLVNAHQIMIQQQSQTRKRHHRLQKGDVSTLSCSVVQKHLNMTRLVQQLCSIRTLQLNQTLIRMY